MELRQRRGSEARDSGSVFNEIVDKTEFLGNQAKDHVLRVWKDLPLWQQDNEYILSGYRPVSGSLKESIESLRHLHNETVNIYSHLLGAMLFMSLPIYAYRSFYVYFSTAGREDLAVFLTFFSGVSICFILSAAFHIINNHSERISVIGNQLDYLGIIALMWGSAIPSIYYGFSCDPHIQKLHWAVISMFAAACAATTLHPKFRSPAIRPWRAVMYTGLGLYTMIYVSHGLVLYGWQVQKLRMSVDYMIATATLNLIGTVTYTSRIPERWYPYKFDYFGSSHQTLHTMVVLAALTYMIGLFRAFTYVHSDNNKC